MSFWWVMPHTNMCHKFCCAVSFSHCTVQHTRSQKFLCRGALFFLDKVDDLFFFFLFLIVALKRQAKSTKLSTPTVHISPIFSKIGLLLCLGVHLQLSPVNLVPQIFSPPWRRCARAPITPPGYALCCAVQPATWNTVKCVDWGVNSLATVKRSDSQMSKLFFIKRAKCNTSR